MSNPFTEHPRSVGETYLQHAGFALKVAGVAQLAALAAALHALFPFWGQTTASGLLLGLADRIREARGRMAARMPQD